MSGEGGRLDEMTLYKNRCHALDIQPFLSRYALPYLCPVLMGSRTSKDAVKSFDPWRIKKLLRSSNGYDQ
jgi:hypothetical protein